MRMPKWLFLILLVVVTVGLGACISPPKNTEGFAVSDSVTINAPFDRCWQDSKTVLREGGYDLFTRDKRGIFVAYTKMKRDLLVAPKRVQFTIAVEPVSETSTKVTIEALKQAYGVTLLTYPGWRDRKTTDLTEAQTLLKAIEAKATGVAPEAPASEAK